MPNSPVLAALACPDREAVIPVDAAFVATNRANLDWLLDRLDKSTAGVRGLIASTPRLDTLSLEEAEKTPQLSPTIVAIIAQAYAQYFLANKPRGNDQPGAFVGFDARFLSSDFGTIFTRVFAGNGVRVLRDHNGEPTSTPVTSFMSPHAGLDGGIEITASHNPPNHNGVKSSTWYGGVDTDDVSDLIAEQVRALVRGGSIRFAALPSPLVEEVDAKGIYLQEYLKATFPDGSLQPLQDAVTAGYGFLFDGLHGVGGMTMRRYLNGLLAPGWEGAIQILNAEPDPRIGGIEKPDPSDPDTLVLSGAIEYLVQHREVLLSVTADMDADRIGTAVIIPESEVARAKKFGLFVSGFEGGVQAVRFTPNQVFTLIAYDRLLTATGSTPQELHAAGRDHSRYHLLTTIATSVLAQQLAETYGVTLHLTAVGFKNLGKLAWQIDGEQQGDVILSLMEESGGAQIGPFRPWNDNGDTIHRDKDTCALALALFNLAARLKLEDRTLLDFYLEMGEQFGSLAYFERLDAYLPDRATAEDPARTAEATAAKERVLERLMHLSDPAHRDDLLRVLGHEPTDVQSTSEADLETISLLVKEGGEWKTIHPRARRYVLASGEQVEVYRAGVNDHDGTRINVYAADGRIRHWCLVRASGTEAVLRAYLEIVEPLESPDPLRLARQFRPLLEFLGLNTFRMEPDQPDYLAQFEKTVEAKYVTS